MKEKCEAGCKVYHGGERKHLKECVFYPGSFTEMYDRLYAKIEAANAIAKVMQNTEHALSAAFAVADAEWRDHSAIAIRNGDIVTEHSDAVKLVLSQWSKVNND